MVIGIIGAENSHAAAFAKIFNIDKAYPGLRVASIWGEEAAGREAVARDCGAEVCPPGEMLHKVEAVMVTSRDGALHARYARPFIAAGKPAFVDKPFTRDADEARALLDLARETGVPVMGGSSTKLVPDVLALREAAKAGAIGGHVWAPVSMDNPYGGFDFYAAHLIEIALTVFGFAPRAARAEIVQSGLAATLYYADFAVALTFTEGVYRYGATVLTDGAPASREIDISAGYALEVAHFAQMLKTGVSPQTAEELLAPVAVLKALGRAARTGGREEIGYVEG